MVDIFARLDTSYGEAGTYVPKMNPDMWGLTLEEVTGAPSGNHPEEGEPMTQLEGGRRGRQMLAGHPVDRTDEEKTWSTSGYGSKTGGSQEKAAKAAAKAQRESASAGSSADNRSQSEKDADRRGTTGDGKVPDHLQTSEHETAGGMTQKPIQAPALGPDGDGNVANDPLPGGEGEVISKSVSSAVDPKTGLPLSQTIPGDAHRGHSDNASPQDKHAAALADKVDEASAGVKSTAEHDVNKGTSSRKDADGKDMPSRSALMAMNRGELEKFARKHNVDPEGATKEQIADTLLEG